MPGDQDEGPKKYFFEEDDDHDLDAKKDRLSRGLKEKLVYK